jgi:hypothetical protein
LTFNFNNDKIHQINLFLLERTDTGMSNPSLVSHQRSAKNDHHQLLPITRRLAAVIVPILVAAFIMLYLFPNDSGRLFAWPISPPMSAMMLGATYLGGAYFFTRVVLAKSWHSVQLGFIPVSTFAGILGIATLLHWDKFTPGHISFILWALLYFTLPFVIAWVWRLNQRATQREVQDSEQSIARGLRLGFGALGAILVGASVLLFLFPQLMIPAWPWTLTPLTARVMAAMFALSGLVGLGVARDGYWSSASVIFQAQGISILFFLLAMIRASSDIQWDQWGAWAFLGGLLAVLILIVLATLQMKSSST